MEALVKYTVRSAEKGSIIFGLTYQTRCWREPNDLPFRNSRNFFPNIQIKPLKPKTHDHTPRETPSWYGQCRKELTIKFLDSISRSIAFTLQILKLFSQTLDIKGKKSTLWSSLFWKSYILLFVYSQCTLARKDSAKRLAN